MDRSNLVEMDLVKHVSHVADGLGLLFVFMSVRSARFDALDTELVAVFFRSERGHLIL